MWNYEKRLQYPVNISTPNPKIAQVILSQFGGPDCALSGTAVYYAVPECSRAADRYRYRSP